MARAFWASVVPPLLLSLALSFLLERLIRPRVHPVVARGVRNVGVHVAIWLCLFSLEFLVFRRPWLAAANVCVLLYVFVLISNAKFQALREPFIYQDFDYCTDMLRHPRLYLPFLGLTRGLLGLSAIAGALSLGLKAEPSVLHRVSGSDFIAGVTVMLTVGGLLLWWGSRAPRALTWEPQQDLTQMGFLPSLWSYCLAERSRAGIAAPAIVPSAAMAGGTRLPDIVAVQSESFFDPRRHYSLVQRHVLSEFDNILRDGAASGTLSVPAWGANTVRTEFAFLTGIGADTLGVHRFNPYRKLVTQPWTTLASRLRALGYQTLCVHPYPASFYRRDRIYPLLGFERFVDIGEFDADPLAGPYVDDLTLARKVCDLVDGERDAQPKFLFVITMENHGPLHLEAREPELERQFCSSPLPAGCGDLAVYLKHLKNADRMIAMLRAKLESRQHASWLCWYGDHVPIMEGVYRTLGYPDGSTDYFLWSNAAGAAPSARCNLHVHELGEQLLRSAKLEA